MSTKKEVQISSYSKRLKDNVKAILENYGEILKASQVVEGDQKKVEMLTAHVENEIEVRAANIVRAAESLSKLVSDLKEYLILNDFSTINEMCTQRTAELTELQRQNRTELEALYSRTGWPGGGGGGRGGGASSTLLPQDALSSTQQQKSTI